MTALTLLTLLGVSMAVAQDATADEPPSDDEPIQAPDA